MCQFRLVLAVYGNGGALTQHPTLAPQGSKVGWSALIKVLNHENYSILL